MLSFLLALGGFLIIGPEILAGFGSDLLATILCLIGLGGGAYMIIFGPILNLLDFIELSVRKRR